LVLFLLVLLGDSRQGDPEDCILALDHRKHLLSTRTNACKLILFVHMSCNCQEVVVRLEVFVVVLHKHQAQFHSHHDVLFLVIDTFFGY